MIKINELKRSDRGASCNICKKANLVKELKFKPDDGDGGTCIFICEQCRDDLKDKLEVNEFYENCR